jgi:putative transposase
MNSVNTAKELDLASLAKICAEFKIKHDAYYKYVKRFEQSKLVKNKVLEPLKKERIIQPRVGTRKLIKELNSYS